MMLDAAMALRNAKEWAMKLDHPLHTEFGWPILWAGDVVYVCDQCNQYQLDEEEHTVTHLMPRRIPRTDAVKEFYSQMHSYHHLGDVPTFKRDTHQVSRPQGTHTHEAPEPPTPPATPTTSTHAPGMFLPRAVPPRAARSSGRSLSAK